MMGSGFNPAEAEDGFRRRVFLKTHRGLNVSIQPKPKTGLEVSWIEGASVVVHSFNPAEAEDGFRSENSLLCPHPVYRFNPAEAEDGFRSCRSKLASKIISVFQSSRSRRRV